LESYPASYCWSSLLLHVNIQLQNGFDIKDLGTLIAMWSAMVGFNMAKTQALKE